MDMMDLSMHNVKVKPFECGENELVHFFLKIISYLLSLFLWHVCTRSSNIYFVVQT